MARLDSWLSPDVMHALGWALIHSLGQCPAVSEKADELKVFSRRPSVRYLVAVSALGLMLALPVATFFVLIKPAVPVQAGPTDPGMLLPAAPAMRGSHFRFARGFNGARLSGYDHPARH